MLVGAGGGGDAGAQGHVGVLSHIAFMYLSPRRATLQRMEVMDEPSVGRCDAKATGEWLTLWRAFGSLDVELSWGVQVYELLRRRSPMAFFAPDVVHLHEATGINGEFLAFWTPRARRRQQNKQAAAAVPAIEDRVDAMEIDEGDGDDNDAETQDDQAFTAEAWGSLLEPRFLAFMSAIFRRVHFPNL